MRRSRVTPGRSSTSASLRPTRRLNSVDLPTLGRPTMATVKPMGEDNSRNQSGSAFNRNVEPLYLFILTRILSENRFALFGMRLDFPAHLIRKPLRTFRDALVLLSALRVRHVDACAAHQIEHRIGTLADIGRSKTVIGDLLEQLDRIVETLGLPGRQTQIGRAHV